MITLIIKCYLSILLSIGAGGLFIFIIGLYFIFKTPSSPRKIDKEEVRITDDNYDDLSSIAGDDVISTQLDLARAYIETDKKQSAKVILEDIVERGTAAQRLEAQQLLNYI